MRYVPILFIMILCGKSSLAQNTNISFTLNPIALLDIESVNPTTVNFEFGIPTEAGNGLTAPITNSDNRINITSAVTISGSRRVEVSMIGSPPAGTRLRLQTTGPTASAVGNVGAVSNPDLYITNVSQTIINNVRGGYTTNGTNRGYRLYYSIEVQDFSQLRAATQTVQIVYTLVDNSN